MAINEESMRTTHKLQDIFDYAESRDFGELHVLVDQSIGLRAIIAIHSTKLGPALGGCRCIEYPCSNAAFHDAMRLARAMSYKAALANLAYGGGKSVLMKPLTIANRKAYFEKLGEFIEQLNGQYIAAEDSGTTSYDMDIIAHKTRHVVGLTKVKGDPSPFTAIGVKRGIDAAIETKLGKSSLQGIHVAIQGVGQVGYYLAKELYQSGVKLTVSDVNPTLVQRCVDEFKAQPCPVDIIHKTNCDIYAPCALGATLNNKTIPEIKAPIVAGAANNQLHHTQHGIILDKIGILYAPDYVINAGGLIYAASQYDQTPIEVTQQKVDNIHQSLKAIFKRSREEKLPTSTIADLMAEERLDIKRAG